MVFPDYHRVADVTLPRAPGGALGHELDPKPGLTVVEIIDAIHQDEVKGMYIMGENPAMSDPDAHHAREALAKLEHLVVQDIFLTETAMLRRRRPAGLGLAREGRHGDQHQPAGAARPQGAADAGRGARRTGGSPRSWRGAWAWPGATPAPADVFAEMKQAMPSLDNITWERLEREGAGHLSVRRARPARPSGRVRGRRLPDRGRPRQAGPGRRPAAGRAARRDLPLRPDDRPHARALAHRRHDPAGQQPRRARARAVRVDQLARPAQARRQRRRPGAGGDAARRDRADGPAGQRACRPA